MATTRARLLVDPTFREPDFEPYTLAIGSLVLIWNDLHERLAWLFWILLRDDLPDRAIECWNSLRFDSPRRQALKDAAKEVAKERSEFSKMSDEITWLCDRLDVLRALETTPFTRHCCSQILLRAGTPFGSAPFGGD
jgi:hypothetical protein